MFVGKGMSKTIEKWPFKEKVNLWGLKKEVKILKTYFFKYSHIDFRIYGHPIKNNITQKKKNERIKYFEIKIQLLVLKKSVIKCVKKLFSKV